MGSPPTRVAPTTQTPLPMGRRENKAARRLVLVQCVICKASASASVNGRGRVVSVNLAADFHRGHVRHRGCGGDLRAFDIAEADG